MTLEQEIRTYQQSCKENYQVLSERPEGMSFEAYKLLLKMQKSGTQKYMKGQMVYVAKNHLLPKEKGVSLVKKK